MLCHKLFNLWQLFIDGITGSLPHSRTITQRVFPVVEYDCIYDPSNACQHSKFPVISLF